MDEIFCLKRDTTLSNLPETHSIKTIRKSNSCLELKVALINLFDAEGKVTILELWNEEAVHGVTYLWKLLEEADDVLLRFRNLHSSTEVQGIKTTAYRGVPPTQYMLRSTPYPIKERIVATPSSMNWPNHLANHCKKICHPANVQLLWNGQPLIHFSQWHTIFVERNGANELQDLFNIAAVDNGGT